jgi:intein/homing endonuclease
MSFIEGIFGRETKLDWRPIAAYPTRKSPVLPTIWTKELAEFVGYLMADGHIVHSNYNNKPDRVVLSFGWEDDELIKYFAAIIKQIFGKEPIYRTTKSCPVLDIPGVDIAGGLEQLGAGGKSGAIRVPPSIFNAPREIVAAFLRGYFEGDGCASSTSAQIFVRSTSRGMLEDVQQLLTLFGIPSNLKGGKPDPRGYAPRYTLAILGDRSKRVFQKQIEFLSKKKQQYCAATLASQGVKSAAESLTLPPEFDLTPLKPAIYQAHRRADGRVPISLMVFASKFVRGHQTMKLSRAEWVLSSLSPKTDLGPASFLQEAISAQYYEVQVADISYEAAVTMYDIAVEEVEQYIAQGIVVHNSVSPNLQNIPIRTEMGRRIRRAFIPANGHVLLSADYSQIELRLLAHVTRDEVMLETFRRGEDIHARTASAVFKAKTAEEMKDARRKAKIVNFGIAYVIGPFGLAQRVGISRNEAKKVIDEYYQTYAGVKKYMDELPDRARENGCEVRSIFGRKRRVPDLEGKGSARARAEREAVNMPMQGCLPSGTKVLTSEGYRAIGRLYGEQRRDLKIWTGSEFASFEVLNRGRCELAELHLSNGHILKCDTRHEVLTLTEEGYAWKHYSDLNTGDRICLSLAREMEFGKLPTPEYVHTPVAFNGQPLVIEKLDERFFYWLGYYFGDGWIYHRPEDNRWYLSYSLGASKEEGRHGLLAKAEECRAYFGSLGLKTNLRWQSLQKAEIKVFSKGLINFLAEIGVNTRANAMTKRAPEFVFSSPLASRKAFLRGFLDADGYAGDNGATNPSIHLCQRDLLVDLWLLFRTVGVEGKLRGPYNYQKDFISYRLDLIGGQVGRSLGYSNCHFIHIPSMHAPAFLTAAFLAEVPSSRFGEGSYRVLYSRLKQGGAISVYTLAEMLRAADHQLSLPLYAWSSLRQKRELGIIEETYTLAVDDSLHRFDSEGVISKNTASDIVKLAMLRVAESLRREKLKAKMILQVHDELVFEVPKKEVEKTSQVVKAAMENAAKIDAPLIVEIGVGENWVDAKP